MDLLFLPRGRENRDGRMTLAEVPVLTLSMMVSPDTPISPSATATLIFQGFNTGRISSIITAICSSLVLGSYLIW